VEIENGEGSAYEFLEEGPGEYQGLSLVHFLKAGEAYRLLLVTPDQTGAYQLVVRRFDSEGIYFENIFPFHVN
jgi:hypothetical protein